MKALRILAAVAMLAAVALPLAAQDKPTLIVGAIYIGSVNDYGYNRSMKDGLEEMKKTIPGLKLIEAENVPESAEAERVIETMIQQGAKLIFPTSFGHMDPALNVANRHPDVFFYHPGRLQGRQELRQLLRQVAGRVVAHGHRGGAHDEDRARSGSSSGMPIGYTLGNVNAFELGARSVNPKAEIRVVVTGSWSDKAKEAAAANALLDQGCDVLTMHVDSPATIIQAAEARGAMSIGFQSVESQQLAPKGWITGLGFTWGGFMTEVAKSVIAGTFKSGFVRRGIDEGMMAMAPFGASVPARGAEAGPRRR